MNQRESLSSARDEQLAELILQFIDSVESGVEPDREAFLELHPEFRTDLEQFFADRDQMERMAAPLRATVTGDDGFRMSSAGHPANSGDPNGDNGLGQLGEYRLLREVGRGGMGIVYEAEQLSLRRRVALKVLPFAAAIDARHVLRFKNEALAAGMLNHAHIVPVYSVGNERGVHFYSMQLVEGQSLAALIAGLREERDQLRDQAEAAEFANVAKRRGQAPAGDDNPERESMPSLTETDAIVSRQRTTDVEFRQTLSAQRAQRNSSFYRTVARLMLQAAEALHHAHESGIVHRDIKPANLLVDLNGQLRITDFGLAQIRSEVGMTRTGDTPGTLRYMSPEQAAGRRAMVDHRTDVYSLGATFYELLTLSPIFEAHDVQELLTQVFDTQPRPLRQVDRAIPVELETIVLKATSKSPDDRFPAAGDLAADLRRFLDHQPILSRRPLLIDRVRKWARRHPSALIVSLAVLAGVSTILVTAIVLIDGAYRRERLRADEAETQFQLARRSVDELVRVSEEELAFNPAAESVRRRLLTTVLSYYQEFIEQRRGDPRAQESLADARQQVEQVLNGLRALRAAGQIKLLQQSLVAGELQLSSAQQSTARDLVTRVETLWQNAFRDAGRVSATELDRWFIEQSRLNEADLKAMLTSDQLRRLRQLDMQADVAAAFREPEVRTVLMLSDSQLDQIKTIEQQEMALWKAGHKQDAAGTPVDVNSADHPKLTKNERLLKVLTIEQTVAWRELTGSPLAGLQR